MRQLFSGAGVRLGLIGLIGLLLAIPVGLVNDLSRDRQNMREDAIRNISQRWAGRQQIGGPIISVPIRVTRQVSGGFKTLKEHWVSLTTELTIDAELAVESRAYGIYETPVYVADITMQGYYDPTDLLQELGEDAQIEWKDAKFQLPLSDVRGLREIEIQWAKKPLKTRSQQLPLPYFPTGVGAQIPELEPGKQYPFSVQLKLAGTSAIEFLAMSETTSLGIQAPWPDPSFIGQYLPLERTVTDQGFVARWQVLSLNRNFAQVWNSELSPDISSASFGVALIQPADVYQQVMRASKYGLLFIALTFLGLFIFDALSKVRLHPVQYVFVGLALASFFLVLLALSEHLAFGLAYALSALMLIAIIGAYSSVILKQRKRGLIVAALLSVIYGMIYWLLIAEHYSLLIGAHALLILLALAMYVTRNIDWHQPSGETTATATE